MVTVRKGNVMTNVPEERVTDYTSRGYDVVDPSGGSVLKKSVPTDTARLQKEYVEKTSELAVLTKKYEELMEKYRDICAKHDKLEAAVKKETKRK